MKHVKSRFYQTSNMLVWNLVFGESKQANKQTSKQANKQTSSQQQVGARKKNGACVCDTVSCRSVRRSVLNPSYQPPRSSFSMQHAFLAQYIMN